ncbi:MAG: DUF1295 domain-containing protein [Alphaproteobacteria bacterium]|nr:DUF1295 domain-containing protein [Alphaproteobacteria bacterium]
MTLPSLHLLVAAAQILTAAVIAVVLVFISAPYGRHQRAGWGPVLPARLGWVLMESPTVLLFGWWYLRGPHAYDAVPSYFLAMWMLHYVHRTFVFPFRTQAPGRTMPVLVAVLGIAFNTVNAWLNATWISTLGSYDTSWFADARCWLGTSLFFLGLFTNVWADNRLLQLRRESHGRYQVPRGGLYELVSCPNYLGEILEWTGWAIATWSYAGAAFAIYAAANLVPRAVSNHAWYRETFPDYPPRRKAVLPFVM